MSSHVFDCDLRVPGLVVATRQPAAPVGRFGRRDSLRRAAADCPHRFIRHFTHRRITLPSLSSRRALIPLSPHALAPLHRDCRVARPTALSFVWMASASLELLTGARNISSGDRAEPCAHSDAERTTRRHCRSPLSSFALASSIFALPCRRSHASLNQSGFVQTMPYKPQCLFDLSTCASCPPSIASSESHLFYHFSVSLCAEAI